MAYILIAVAAGRLGSTRASATTFLIPAVALMLGVLVRGESVALLSVVGGAVCVAGAWLIRGATLKQQTAPSKVSVAWNATTDPPRFEVRYRMARRA